MATREKVRRTEYFTRGDVLRFVSLSPRQIQYWDETKLIRPTRKTKRRRYYDFANLVELRAVDALRKEGFSTQKIRSFVTTLKRMMPRNEQVLSRLQLHTDGRTLIFQEKGAYFETNGQGLLKLDLERLYHLVRPPAFSKPVGTRERGNLRSLKIRVRSLKAAS